MRQKKRRVTCLKITVAFKDITPPPTPPPVDFISFLRSDVLSLPVLLNLPSKNQRMFEQSLDFLSAGAAWTFLPDRSPGAHQTVTVAQAHVCLWGGGSLEMEM